MKTKHAKAQIKGKAWRSHVAALRRRTDAAHAAKLQRKPAPKEHNPLLFNV